MHCLIVADMAAQSSTMGQDATAGGNSKWRKQWISIISDGLRALVNLTPGAFEGNQYVNTLLTDPWSCDDLGTIASFTAALLRKNENEGHIRWNYTKAVATILEGSKSGTLSGFTPDLSPLKLFGTSDSTLTMYTKTVTRSWETMWSENRQIWARHVSEAHFTVNDNAKIVAIYKALEALLSAKDANRGNPATFSDQVVFVTSMNEKESEPGMEL